MKTSSLVATTRKKNKQTCRNFLKSPISRSLSLFHLQLTGKSHMHKMFFLFDLTQSLHGKNLYPRSCWKQSDVVSQLSKAVIPDGTNRSPVKNFKRKIWATKQPQVLWKNSYMFLGCRMLSACSGQCAYPGKNRKGSSCLLLIDSV